MNQPSIFSPVLCSTGEFLNENFDYLIVGGGTAGLVVASRLSEIPSLRIGVIEAGKNRLGDPNIEIPGRVGSVLNDPEYDWAFQSVPSKVSNKIQHIPRGKLLGGSSGVNFLVYVRQDREIFDNWAALGIRGWSWDEIKPYYMKTEKLSLEQRTDEEKKYAPCFPDDHGFDGPIHTSYAAWKAPIENQLIDAFEDTFKISNPGDPNGGDHLGLYGGLSTIDREDKKGTRSYAASGFLEPHLNRANLKVLTDAIVTKINLVDGTATGATFEKDGKAYTVAVRKEVILSAGSIKSPHLLELSGVGDPDILKEAGVECLVPLPEVGGNLQEHAALAISYEMKPGNVSLDSVFLDPDLFQAQLEEYQRSRTGVFAAGMTLQGFVPATKLLSSEQLSTTISRIEDSLHTLSPVQQAQAKVITSMIANPESAFLQFFGIPCFGNVEASVENMAHFVTGPPAGRNACITLMATTCYPVSRGETHLISPNPHASPRINLALREHETDVDILAGALIMMNKVFQSSCIKDQLVERVAPAPEVDLSDFEQAKQEVRRLVTIINHGACTCAMGTVVDDRLKVNGVKGLRVIDASVLPMQLSGNTMALVYAIAEKGADLIKEDAGYLK